MKSMEKIAASENFTAANVGKMNELSDYVLELGPEVKIPGKVFGGDDGRSDGKRLLFPIVCARYRDGIPAYSQES